MEPLEGILPVVPTPFLDDGSIDRDGFAKVLEFAARHGAQGLVYPGFASEVETLTARERYRLLKDVARSWGHADKIIAGATAESIEDVLTHTGRAMELGISRVMIQPPGWLEQDPEGISEFLSAVGIEFPKVEIVLQNAPAGRGTNLDATQILKVVRAVRQVAYVKEETVPPGPAITSIIENSDRPKHLKGVIGGGGARYIIDEYRRGACAAMPAIELLELHVKLDQAWREGDVQLADHIYNTTLPLLTLQAAYRMRLTKHVLAMRGILENAYVRAPCPDMDAIAVADVEHRLEQLLDHWNSSQGQ